MTREDLIQALDAASERDPDVIALLLGGSLGAGGGDRWSDVDAILVTAPDRHAAVVNDLQAWVSAIAPPVLWRQTFPPHPLFMAVLPGWLRLDITVTVPGHVTGARDRVRALYDPQGLVEALPGAYPRRRPDPRKIAGLVEEFLRVVGLLPVAVGRDEPVLAVTGVTLLRGLLQDLLVEAQAPPAPMGALSLSRLLPAEDVALLAALPLPRAEWSEILEANRRYAAEFLPRARALAAESGASWPTALEAEAAKRLARDAGLDWSEVFRGGA
ncbi:hypothetical protein [Phenylobacterium sp. SCN 70-31]|uniref:hypothetical protein n=1 Tax=Phenylobacterium sp. SCN 70-31 TaxID=1660129 RepID=UPI0025FBB913|nr:hypothetical protein [Phenylobacterium sp. SCN 70-31]